MPAANPLEGRRRHPAPIRIEVARLITPLARERTDSLWRRERGTTLLVVVVGKHYLSRELMARGKTTRGAFPSQPP
jgi:hypothetical protein